MTITRRLLWLLMTIALGCASSVATRTRSASDFQVEPAELRSAGATDDLLDRIVASPFRYFRLLADASEARTCDAFREESDILPVVALHGDAHLEQFVVTDTTFGMEDFDRAGFGPAVIDLVRYAASIHVACHAHAWCEPEPAVAAFLDAYRATLAREPTVRAPSIVSRIRATVAHDATNWLAWGESTMIGLAPAVEQDVRAAWRGYTDLMSEIRPDVPSATFEIIALGSHRLGIGSALERKLVFRVAGPSSAPEDDLLLEAREGTPPSSANCMWRPHYGESMILVFAAILGRRVPSMHGFVPMMGSDRRFWVQAWDPGYRELTVEDIHDQSELQELAVDAAHQLGGHLWANYPRQVLPYHLHAQRNAFAVTRQRVETLAREIAAESIRGWREFQAAR